MRRWAPPALVAALLALSACTGTGPDASGRPHDIGSKAGAPTYAPQPDPSLHALAAGTALDPCPELPPVEAVAGGLPRVVVPCMGPGPAVAAASLRGPALVNLWGSYCDICIEEMPVLEQAYQRWGGRLSFLGVDVADPDPRAAYELLASTGVTYPTVVDADGQLRDGLPGARLGLPYTLFVDASGRIVHYLPGGIRSVDALADLVRAHLGLTLR